MNLRDILDSHMEAVKHGEVDCIVVKDLCSFRLQQSVRPSAQKAHEPAKNMPVRVLC